MSHSYSCTSTPYNFVHNNFLVSPLWAVISCHLNATLCFGWTIKVKNISCNPHRQLDNKNGEHLVLRTWLLNANCRHLNTYLSSQLQSMPLPIVSKVAVLKGFLFQVPKKHSTLPKMLDLKAVSTRLVIWQVNCQQKFKILPSVFQGVFLPFATDVHADYIMRF